uniref:protein FAM149B1 isoform X2 n=1 Tax=Doryrhamphus excisus TaxID=161450 RepID=UPI0025AE3CC6|nr:protein FAM149B1 isoform X2 [Doryrhamphus excisus]
MISRYNRKPVSHKLEIRGLSHSSLNHHPLPEEADTQPPQCSLQDVEEDTPIHNSHSDCPTVISVASSRSWSGIHSSTDTGISTERSSVFSWGYDEFDNAASRQVQRMFEEIDKELYEGKGSGGGILPGLQDECQQWAERFPHLRILGTQLLCPSDKGFQWYKTSGAVSSSIPSACQKSMEKEESGAELNVKGCSAALLKSSSADLDVSIKNCKDRPRVIEAEGHMEEYLAFDSISLEDEWKCSEPSLRHRCMPPVSPYKCRRQAVLDQLFDDVWRQLVGCMRELVQRQWECHAINDERTSGNASPSPFTLSTIPTMLPKLGHGRAPHLPMLATSLQFQRSRDSKHKSRRKSKRQKRPPSAGKAQHNLNDLIMIHSIPLQQRNLAALDRTQEPEERAPLRPGSSLSPVSKPRTRRVLEQSSSSLTRPPQSARRRNLPPRTLQPLAPNLSQSSAVGSMDEVIRGTRLPTASDRLMSPLFALSRNTLLPPIGTGDVELSPSGQHSKAAQRQKGPSIVSRAHSAINDEVASSIPRDRLYPLEVFSRPNTTHTYRSDTPYRRSFTVLDNIGQGRTGRASIATDSLGIGVTGVSLGIASSSFLDSFSHHHPSGHWPIRDEEEEPDVKALPTAALVPVSVPPRAHSRGGFSSRLSRPGL